MTNKKSILRPHIPGTYKFICEKHFGLGSPGIEFVGIIFKPEKFRWSFYGTKGNSKKGWANHFSWPLKDFYGNGYFIKI